VQINFGLQTLRAAEFSSAMHDQEPEDQDGRNWPETELAYDHCHVSFWGGPDLANGCPDCLTQYPLQCAKALLQKKLHAK
jgi:hypothetical protein